MNVDADVATHEPHLPAKQTVICLRDGSSGRFTCV